MIAQATRAIKNILREQAHLSARLKNPNPTPQTRNQEYSSRASTPVREVQKLEVPPRLQHAAIPVPRRGRKHIGDPLDYKTQSDQGDKELHPPACRGSHRGRCVEHACPRRPTQALRLDRVIQGPVHYHCESQGTEPANTLEFLNVLLVKIDPPGAFPLARFFVITVVPPYHRRRRRRSREGSRDAVVWHILQV